MVRTTIEVKQETKARLEAIKPEKFKSISYDNLLNILIDEWEKSYPNPSKETKKENDL